MAVRAGTDARVREELFLSQSAQSLLTRRKGSWGTRGAPSRRRAQDMALYRTTLLTPQKWGNPPPFTRTRTLALTLTHEAAVPSGPTP